MDLDVARRFTGEMKTLNTARPTGSKDWVDQAAQWIDYLADQLEWARDEINGLRDREDCRD